MWLLNIFLGGKLSRKIPNYHNEEDAFRLLQNWWTEYVPAPTSIIKDLQITWTKGGVRVLQPSPPKEIPNPFQLRPSSIKNKIISFRDKHNQDLASLRFMMGLNRIPEKETQLSKHII